ncbi:daptide biosynthesis RiPP recognition protein [Actinacidiphila sp. ITFR-21]|uniref:daptide biosynthesis RiPP recognition protein n=1 Tax=Actinacidiphila sp. ITFR-21 TaxID=3075199 RepID=UPI00288BC5DB|nr:daptide biosynthesis RiPP recognition protein [Streptomyces sp. ITFR-21]WNI16181.1 daptide biosynthesis RiPP recognition protein [Streptomyces sp. ITFR-21]
MSDGGEMKRVRQHLLSWATGRPFGAAGPGSAVGAPAAARTVLLDDASLAEPLTAAGLVDGHSVVFVPQDPSEAAEPARSDAAAPTYVGYGGSLAEPGGELSLGQEFFLESRDYAAAAYMPLLGPTLVTVTGPDDFELFLADADLARETGRFPEFAVAAPVRLAQLPALSADRDGDGPGLRLHVDADGGVSTAWSGVRVGTLDDGPAGLYQTWQDVNESSAAGCAVCLGAVLDEPGRLAGLTARPWLGDYLAAVDSLRTLTARGMAGLRVAGFGARLLPEPDTDADPVPDPGRRRAVLLLGDDGACLHQPSTGRTFRLGTGAARCAEALLTLGSADAVTAHVGDLPGLADVAGLFAGLGLFPAAGQALPVRAGA